MTVVSSRGCLALSGERRSGDRLITGQEGSPPRPCLRQCARLEDWRGLFFLFSSNQWLVWLALGSCGRRVSVVQAQRQIHRALRPVSASWCFGMGSLSALVLERWLGEAGDRPNKADHFAGDRGHNAGACPMRPTGGTAHTAG